MANKTVLFSLDIETSQYVKKVQDAEIKVADLRSEQERLQEQLQSVGDAFGYNSKQYDDLNKKIKAYGAAIKVAEGDVKNANKQLEDQVRQTNAAEGSYEALYRQWKNAEIALKTQAGNMRQLADGTFELTEQGKKAAAQVLKLKEGVLTFNAEIKDGRLNVGNYSQAIGEYFNKAEAATRGTGAFGNAIGGIGDAITQTSAGIDLLKKGVSGFQDGLNVAGNSIKSFFVSTQGGGAFSTFNENAEDAVENVTELGTAGQDAGKKIGIGTNIGANGFKILRVALISTGIGAIVVAVASLLAYFSTLQSVTDKLKGVFAGLTAIFKTYLQTVFDIAKAIATLDFGKAFDSLTGFFGKASDAAQGAYALNEAKIELEETDIRNVKILDELNDKAERSRLLAEDKTKTDEERIQLIKDANDAELQALKIEEEREKKNLKIQKSELDKAKATGEATREQRLAYEELEKALGDIQDKIANKEAQTLSETSKLRRQFANDRINSEIGILNNQLKLAELNGRQTFALQRKIAQQELNAALSDTQISEDQKKKLRSDFNVKVAEINKAASDAQLARQKELQQLSINNIVDGQTREVAAIGFATQQKLDAIQKGTEQEKELRLRIAEEGAKEILAVAQKYAEQTQAERQAVLAGNTQIQQNEIDSEAAKQQQLLKLELSYIDTKQNKTQEDLIFQQNAAQASLKIEEDRLQKQLELQLNATGQRIANEQAYYDELENKAKNAGLSKEALAIRLAEIDKERQAAELKTEQESGAQINAITNAINENRVQQTLTANQQIVDNNAKLIEEQAALNEAVTGTILTGLGALSDALSSNEKDQKKFALLNKSIALAELVINLQKEISGYWAGVGRDAATGGFILGTVSSAKATAQTVAASIRAAAGIAKIGAQKFETGGFTVEDAVKKYNPSISGSFKGGFVSTPTMWPGMGRMNLAGEAGTEYVSPNWQIKQAPGLFSALEMWRRTGVRPFADGGFTTSTITQPLQQNAALIESAIVRGFASAPAPVVSVQEINDTQQRVTVIESRSTL